MSKLVILDRDGVINVDLSTGVKTIDQFELLPHVGVAIARLNKAGYKVALATNQANIGRGIINFQTVQDIHTHMQEQLEKSGAVIDQIYVCPDHTIKNSRCRKPLPGMLLKAMKDFNTSADKTIMIGDDQRDLEAAIAANCASALVLTGKGQHNIAFAKTNHIPVYNNLKEAADAIIAA